MNQTPFTRKDVVDKPGIIGASWWQESIASPVPRRQAMTAILAVGGVVAAIASVGACVGIVSSSSSSDPDVIFQPRAALDMQKEYGWSFGAVGEAMVFDGQSTQPFDRAALLRMATDLAPSSRYTPYYVPTLFQSLTATPKAVPSGETAQTFVPVSQALSPIYTPAMEAAFNAGQSLASLLDARANDASVIVDLSGPEAVAFAAGAANVLEPVFLFDNWPHPRGVVPAHLTLAAAAYYQPLFVKARATRPKTARPLFVLDRRRLASYTDEASQFDNRHTARVPGVTNLAALGTKNVLYVSPNAVDRTELDDLVDDFLAYGPKIAIRTLPQTAFEASNDPTSAGSSKDAGTTTYGGPYFYGGTRTTHPTFWNHWAAPSSGLSTNDVQIYTPAPRKTPYSFGTAATTQRQRPPNFGMIPVAIAVGTGVILGAKLSRSGSWNRTSSSSSSS